MTHLYLPPNRLEQDNNGERIMAACRFLKSSLRLKKGAYSCCLKFGAAPFLAEEEWKSEGEFEKILRDTSRLTAACQNEEKLSGACGLVVRKSHQHGL